MKRTPMKRFTKPMAQGGLAAATSAQKAVFDKLIDQVGCAVCRFHMGLEDSPAEIHHIVEGGVRLSHWMVIPLCSIHHRQGTEDHPGRHSVNGNHGGLEVFERLYGSEQSLLESCERWINIEYSHNYNPDGLLNDDEATQSDDRHTHTDADNKPDDGDARPEVEQLQAFNTPVHISVTHYRARLCDPDNLNAKGVIDAIVTAGLLQDDSAAYVKSITHQQIKVKGYDKEKTRVTITEVAA